MRAWPCLEETLTSFIQYQEMHFKQYKQNGERMGLVKAGKREERENQNTILFLRASMLLNHAAIGVIRISKLLSTCFGQN